MSSKYQSMVILMAASFFVVVIWYIDKELKSVHANIKIIQNMLKTVIANQNNQMLYQPVAHPVHIDNIDNVHYEQVPAETGVVVEEVEINTAGDAIVDKVSGDESIQEAEYIPYISSQPGEVSEPGEAGDEIDDEVDECEVIPQPVNEIPKPETKKKRSYVKKKNVKNEITV